MANEQVKYQQAHENVLIARRRLARLEERAGKPGPGEPANHSGTRTPTAEEKQQIEEAKAKLLAAEKAEHKAQLALHRSLT